MEHLSADYWRNRYQKQDTVWDIGHVSDPLKTYIDRLTDTSIRILIPGAGNAYEAEYLWQKGFHNIHILDIIEEPLKNLHKRCPAIPETQLILQDFFAHQGQYDLILEQTFFCALDPALRPPYAEKMQTLLKPGACLAGVLFDTDFRNPGPPYGGHTAEYQSLFEKYFVIKTLAPCYNSIAPRAGSEVFIQLIR